MKRESPGRSHGDKTTQVEYRSDQGKMHELMQNAQILSRCRAADHSCIPD
jgi:hypothetical protein